MQIDPSQFKVSSFSEFEPPEQFKSLVEIEKVVWSNKITNHDEILNLIYENLGKDSITIEYIEKLFTRASQKRPLFMKDYAEIYTIISKKYNRVYRQHNWNFAGLLKNRGAEIDCEYAKCDESKIISKYEENSLGWIISYNEIDKFKEMSSKDCFDYNQMFKYDEFDYYGTSLLDIAAQYGSEEIFRFLIVNGAAITPESAENAIIGGNFEIMSVIRQKGGSFDNCLEKCLEYHHNDYIDWLLDNYKQTMISVTHSLYYMNYEASFYFIENGFDLNQIFTGQMEDWKKTTPLIAACLNNQLELVKYFLSHGANVNLSVYNQVY